ncbi:YmaF family protein [Paenibacillus roseipurpureus]|uniref:YmaF family protein n=1 Tax=Paenibacillus roseopurpureus TaxID=2918901 RepID=A0AA96LJ07_9BACL|nr:YmaF family protein [Paenibacillus sp. MBLB1832]WNR42585.1 YmaF family protein [Paenibacillus sp. MBLB1832]
MSNVPPAHVHFFTTITSETLSHHHLLRLYTFSVNGTSYDGHVHQYQGISGIKYGHYHAYYGVTGPPIALANGEHFHMLDGIVDLNLYNTSRRGTLMKSAKLEGIILELHQHLYQGYTSVGFGYEPW